MNILIQIIVAFILADIITGAFHWFEDTYLSYCINFPILSSIAKENEMHHYFPRNMLAYSYFENIELSLILSLTFIILIYFINRPLLYKYNVFFITFFIFASTANLFHRFCHMRDCEKSNFLINIQKTGLLCSHEHHSKHHRTNGTKYCVITEYSNYFLDGINFWRRLEYIIYIITGITPNRVSTYNDYKEIHNIMHLNSKLECPNKPTIEQIKDLQETLHKFKMKNCANKKNV